MRRYRPLRRRLPTHIAFVEIRKPIADLIVPPGHDLLVVVTFDGRPVGTIRPPVVRERVVNSELRSQIILHLRSQIIHMGMVRALERGTLRGTTDQRTSAVFDEVPSSPELPCTVTIAVCTRNRSEQLRECLNAIQASSFGCEILVIDNAPSTNSTEELVRAYPSIRYLREDRPGLDWARNRAALEAKSEIILFVDDDVEISSDYVQRVSEAFATNPDIMCVTGLVIPKSLSSPAQQMFERRGGFGRGFKRRWMRGEFGSHVAVGHIGGTGDFGTGASLALRRQVLAEIGLFDPALDVGTITSGGGDLDIMFRVLKAGWIVLYDPYAYVLHEHRSTMPELERQIGDFGSLVSMFQAEVQRFPEERKALFRVEIDYLGGFVLRKALASIVHPDDGLGRLARVELKGHARSLLQRRYRKAQRVAAEIETEHGPQPGNLPEPPAKIELPTFDRANGIATRTIDVDRLPDRISDLAGFHTVRIFIRDTGTIIGQVDVKVQGRTLSRDRLAEVIVGALGSTLLTEPGLTSAHAGLAIEHAWHKFNEYLLLDAQNSASGSNGSFDDRAANSNSPLSVSIVISTANRPDDLRRCLRSLEACLSKWSPMFDVEVVVCNNRPEDRVTTAVLQEFPFAVGVEEPRAGLSYGRNAAMLASKGSILVSLDDDEVVESDWLVHLLEPFGDESVHAVTGNVLPAELHSNSQQLSELHSPLGKGFITRRFDESWFDAFGARWAVPTWDIGAAANLAVRRRVIEDQSVGLLEESLGPGTPTGVGEDTMMLYRILATGGTIVYQPKACTLHYHRADIDALNKQQRAYMSGHFAYNLHTVFSHGDLRGLYRFKEVLKWHVVERHRVGSDLPASVWKSRVIGSATGPMNYALSQIRVNRLGRSGAWIVNLGNNENED
jgi:O-antigen biosynthesis protein